jgi:hypothetical protein
MESACHLAQQLHLLLKETTGFAQKPQKLYLTASVACYPTDGKTVPELIHSLDEAMLLVKNSIREGVAAAKIGILSSL